MPSCNLKLQLCTHCRDMCVKCVFFVFVIFVLRCRRCLLSILFYLIGNEWINARELHHSQFKHSNDMNSDHCNILLTKRTCLCRRRIICYDKTIEYKNEKKNKIQKQPNEMENKTPNGIEHCILLSVALWIYHSKLWLWLGIPFDQYKTQHRLILASICAYLFDLIADQHICPILSCIRIRIHCCHL